MKAAAVILVMVAVGAAVYLNMSRKPAMEMVQINTVNEANTLIKTLNDGSVIYIAQNSLFSFPKEFEPASRNVELKGEAFFDITPNPDKPFIIETDEALIQVLGTAFNVKTQNGKSFELFVDRGKVKVTLKKDPSHSEYVIAGEKITTQANSLVKSKYIAGEASSWYRQRMHFKDESLQNIISVLKQETEG
jgi:ferric-dicitrate binding protein FerR (iron transport regulator)